MTFSCSDSSYFHPSCSFSLTYKCITVHFILKELAVHPISILQLMLKKQDALSYCHFPSSPPPPQVSLIHANCPPQVSVPWVLWVIFHLITHRLQHFFLAHFTLSIIPRELPFPMSISVSFLCQYTYNLMSSTAKPHPSLLLVWKLTNSTKLKFTLFLFFLVLQQSSHRTQPNSQPWVSR